MSSKNSSEERKRVIVYVDGFNLYFGLKSKNWKNLYWLDIVKLASNLLKDFQELIEVKYFTSRISFPPDKVKRQGTFIEALETLDGISIYYGNYQSNKSVCRKCANVTMIPSEKMTDVNIAVELLTDAFEDKFDIALLISADSDLSAPINKVHQLFINKKVIVAFPPGRFSFVLQKIAKSSFTIGRKRLADSLFPDKVEKKNGYVLKRPSRWKSKSYN